MKKRLIFQEIEMIKNFMANHKTKKAIRLWTAFLCAQIIMKLLFSFFQRSLSKLFQ